MCPVQTTYSTEHAAAYEGQKASVSELMNSRSFFAEGSDILPGRVVARGTDPDKQCVLPSAAADGDLLGIVLREINRVVDGSDVSENQDRPITVINHGTIWGRCIDGCDPGDPVHVVINVAGGDALGQLRSAQETTNTVLMTGVQWITTAAAGELAQLSFARR